MRQSRVDIFLRDFDQLLVTEGDRLLLADLRQDLLNSDYDFAEIILHQLLNDELFGFDELVESDELAFDAFDTLHFHGEPITKRLWQYEIADILRERLVEYTNSHYYRTKVARRYSELDD